MKIDFVESPAQIALPLALAGRIADSSARRRIFLDYQERKTDNTLRQQQVTLTRFRAWLTNAAADPGDLYTDPESWSGIRWGLIADFIRYELGQGYAVASLNSHLATLKRYAALALQAGALDHQDYVVIQTITGYSHKEGRNLDRKRRQAGLPTRTGKKAKDPIFLNPDQVKALLSLPDPETPQGCRDSLLLHLLLHLGLRCGEVAGLPVEALTQRPGLLHFYRPKVDKWQTHKLNEATAGAARRLLTVLDDPDPESYLIRRSLKNRRLLEQGMSERAINLRVEQLGVAAGIEDLGPHSCRHTWATNAANAGTPLPQLMEAGGWSGPGMPLRYIEAAKIANAGVIVL